VGSEGGCVERLVFFEREEGGPEWRFGGGHRVEVSPGFFCRVCVSQFVLCVCVGVSECVRVCVCVCEKKTCGVWRGRWARVQGSVLGFCSVQFSPVLLTSHPLPPSFLCVHAFYLSLFCLFSPCRVFSACATLFF
jgi:hypothetical protein